MDGAQARTARGPLGRGSGAGRAYDPAVTFRERVDFFKGRGLGLAEASYAARRWTADLHPRDRRGQWLDVPDAPKVKVTPLNSLNPTGGVFVGYDPTERAIAPLGPDMTTLDRTEGGSPDDPVMVYRGAPKGSTIAPGDFVTTNRQLAQDYAGSGGVIAKEVRKGDVLDSISEPGGEEYIYRPRVDALALARQIAGPGRDLSTNEGLERAFETPNVDTWKGGTQDAAHLDEYLRAYAVNGLLRRGEPLSAPGQGSYDEQAEALDRVIASARTREDVVLFRGVETADSGWDYPASGEFIDPGYTSASTEAKTAEEFADGGTVAVIRVPKGTPALATELTPGDVVEKWGQDEVVLPRGSRFRVANSTTSDDGQRVVTLDLLPPVDPESFDERLGAMKTRDVEQMLVGAGFQQVRQRGSHAVFKKAGNPRAVILPMHARTMPRGTMMKVLRTAGLNDSMVADRPVDERPLATSIVKLTSPDFTPMASAGMALSPPKSGKSREFVAQSVAAIDKVLRLPPMPLIPVVSTSGKSARGAYERKEEYGVVSPKRIKLSVNEGGPALTMTHEFGHFLDNVVLSEDRSQLGSMVAGIYHNANARGDLDEVLARAKERGIDLPEPDPLVYDVIDALRSTRASRALDKSSYSTFAQHSYLNKPVELFARGFAQYVAIRSSNPALIADLRKWTDPASQLAYHQDRENAEVDAMNRSRAKWTDRMLPYSTYSQDDVPTAVRYRQWDDEDFEPVAAAFDRLFAAKGMLR